MELKARVAIELLNQEGTGKAPKTHEKLRQYQRDITTLSEVIEEAANHTGNLENLYKRIGLDYRGQQKSMEKSVKKEEKLLLQNIQSQFGKKKKPVKTVKPGKLETEFTGYKFRSDLFNHIKVKGANMLPGIYLATEPPSELDITNGLVDTAMIIEWLIRVGGASRSVNINGKEVVPRVKTNVKIWLKNVKVSGAESLVTGVLDLYESPEIFKAGSSNVKNYLKLYKHVEQHATTTAPTKTVKIKPTKATKEVLKQSKSNIKDLLVIKVKAYTFKNQAFQAEPEFKTVTVATRDNQLFIRVGDEPQLYDITEFKSHSSGKAIMTTLGTKAYTFRMLPDNYLKYTKLREKYGVPEVEDNREEIEEIEEMIEEMDEQTAMKLTEVTDGDLLNIELSEGDYIVHQTNTISNSASGLAKVLFKAYPDENIYKKSAGVERVVGQAVITKHIIHVMGQLGPGGTKKDDDQDLRIVWFMHALEQLAEQVESGALKVTNLYFPYQIGSGLAGGDWNNYHKAITLFEQRLTEIDPKIKVHIIKKE